MGCRARRSCTRCSGRLSWRFWSGRLWNTAVIAAERVTRTLISLGEKELQDIVDEGETIHIDCQFCDHIYDYTPGQVAELLEELRRED